MKHSMKTPIAALTLALVLVSLLIASTAFAASPHRSAAHLHGRGALLNYVASVEGVTPAVLKQDLAAGKTLLQIAGTKYASADDLATALLKPIKTRLDTAVTNHTLTAAQANTIYSTLHARVATLVVTPHPTLRMLFSAGVSHSGTRAGQSGHMGVHLAGLGRGLIATFATACKTTPAVLKTAFQAGGKSPLAICQATNASITRDGLVAALLKPIQTRLDAAVAAKKITAAQETQFLARIQTRLNTWVTTALPTHS